MKQLLFSSLLCFLAFTSTFSQDNDEKKVVVDENAVVREVGNFSALQISSATTVYISQGKENAVAVSCSDESKTDKIMTEVKNGVLHIYFKSLSTQNWIGNTGKVTAYITITNLESLDISGSSLVKFTSPIQVKSLSVDVSGASVFKGEVIGDEINFDISGASSAIISGKVNSVKFEVSGASVLKALSLTATNHTNVKASGASNAQINVAGKTTIKASGASSVKYKGNASDIYIAESGASSIKKIE